MSQPPVICIAGPTASGKTDLAIELAQHYPCDIISVDSAQIYRGMDIGSAKPDSTTLAQYPHALIDILAPEDSYSAAQFVNDANAHIQQAHAKQRLPVLVGGTMLYFHALYSGLDNLPKSDPDIRADIERQIQANGLATLHQQLAKLDPQSAAKIAPNDHQRIVRFHELMRLSGQTPSQLFAQQQQQTPSWRTIALGLMPERQLLHQRIAQRFEQMMAQGFLQEVATLQSRPNLSAEHPSMRAVGYRQLWAHLDGQHSLEESIELGIIATRQLAKRQSTWLRNRLQTQLAPTLIDPAQNNALVWLKKHPYLQKY